MNRLFLSAAVKKMLVRLVSNLTISSESCGSSSRCGVGEGEGDAAALDTLASLFAERTTPAAQHHANNEEQQQWTSQFSVTHLLNFQANCYGITLSAIAL